MYTKSDLQSSNFMTIYESLAKLSLRDLNFIENLLSKRNNKRNFKVKLNNKRFEINNKTLHYTNKLKNDKGRYINIDVSKIIGDSKVLIGLSLGIEGFDIHSGERYDRKQAKVNYIYQDKVDLLEVKTEEEINQEEESLRECNSKVIKK